MNFQWSNEQLEFKKVVIDFAKNELFDDVINRDKNEEFSRVLWNKCADFGIQGLPFPNKFGGQGQDILSTILMMEGLGYACKDNGLLFGINAQMWSVQMPIYEFGTDFQKGKYLTKLNSGEYIGAHAMSEAGSGSDAFSLNTTATPKGNKYLLNGSKTFVSNASAADLFIVFATVDKRKGFLGITAFVVDSNLPGLSLGNEISKMGLKTVSWREVFFTDCPVPIENRIGKEGNGSVIFENSMEWERSFILAYYIGSMERQIDECIKYTRERKQFNKPIGKNQSVANKITDMKIRMETARLLIYKLAWLKTNNIDAPLDAAVAKLYLSESWIQSCLDAIQIHGGYGYATEYEFERDLRDAISGTIYSGTSEMQRNIIARRLGL